MLYLPRVIVYKTIIELYVISWKGPRFGYFSRMLQDIECLFQRIENRMFDILRGKCFGDFIAFPKTVGLHIGGRVHNVKWAPRKWPGSKSFFAIIFFIQTWQAKCTNVETLYYMKKTHFSFCLLDVKETKIGENRLLHCRLCMAAPIFGT